MSGQELTSVAYKKGNFVRYGLWAIVVVLLIVSAVISTQILKNEFSTTVPSGYKFIVSDAKAEANGNRTTYYVYADSILVDNLDLTSESRKRTSYIYDNVDTSSLELDTEDTYDECDSDACYKIPKVVQSIKKMLHGKIGREYRSS